MFQSVSQVGDDPFVVLAALLLIPIACVWLGRARFASRASRWLAAVALGLYALFTAYFFPWEIFSVYLRWSPLLGWAAACLYAFRRPLAPLPLNPKLLKRSRLALVTFAALTLLLDASLLKGMFPGAQPVELSFPFKGGTFYIAQGGSSFWINYHYGQDPEFKYAVDILQVDALGSRSTGLLPSKYDDYLIYAEPVYSPCSGQVVMTLDGIADSPIFTRLSDEPGGNQIAIDCGGKLVRLEHLLIGSIEVSSGQRVTAGDLLARVGSSGTSSEPHLHIQVNLYKDGVIGACLPITFNGRYLVRNDLFRAP